MVKLVTCAGYHYSGSSVVTDLLKEFKTVKSLGDFEYYFLAAPRGLRDLECGLFELNSRTNVDYYIKQYIKHIHRLSKSRMYNYEKKFDGGFKELSLKLLDDIIDIKWKGYSHNDLMNENAFKRLVYYSIRVLQKYILHQPERGVLFFNNDMFYSNPSSKEDFYLNVKKYTNDLFSKISLEGSQQFIAVDQLVPPTNIESYLNYFNNLKVIVVDRDPRDLFFLQKYKYNAKGMPNDSVDKFIHYFKLIRKNKFDEINNKNIFHVNFEDFIYEYDTTIDALCDFVKINRKDHFLKKKYFDPSISIKNTRVWHEHENSLDELRKIEKELKEYLTI